LHSIQVKRMSVHWRKQERLEVAKILQAFEGIHLIHLQGKIQKYHILEIKYLQNLSLFLHHSNIHWMAFKSFDWSFFWWEWQIRSWVTNDSFLIDRIRGSGHIGSSYPIKLTRLIFLQSDAYQSFLSRDVNFDDRFRSNHFIQFPGNMWRLFAPIGLSPLGLRKDSSVNVNGRSKEVRVEPERNSPNASVYSDCADARLFFWSMVVLQFEKRWR
jgi:hypothetical protein